MAKHFFTSESVTEGHPDKVCDQISDAVVDAILEQDKNAHIACEVTATTGMVHVMGEITTDCYVDIPSIARQVICDIGYDNEGCGFDGNNCAVLTSIDNQSADIALGVNESYELKSGEQDIYNQTGAGDQGMMFGYACNETPELMPLSISLSHKLAKQLTKVRKDGTLPYLRPDGKTQVTVEYDGDEIKRIDAVVVSTQHNDEIETDKLRDDILNYVIKPIIPPQLFDDNTKYISTRQADSSSADLSATLVLQAERLLWTPTAVSADTAAAASRARTRQRLTEAQHTPHAMPQRIL